MTAHTPEPWRLDTDGGSGQYHNIRHNMICSGPYLLGSRRDTGTAKADAARIVACVNACAGINPEAVPDLLAAVEDALIQFGANADYSEDDANSVSMLRAAINKAKP